MIRTRALEGSGVIAVNGGAGNGNGGGGAGGRMAIYWQDREWWYGALTSFGGSSSQGGNGGAGTVYLEVNKFYYLEAPSVVIQDVLLNLPQLFCLPTGHSTWCEEQDSDL